MILWLAPAGIKLRTLKSEEISAIYIKTKWITNETSLKGDAVGVCAHL